MNIQNVLIRVVKLEAGWLGKIAGLRGGELKIV